MALFDFLFREAANAIQDVRQKVVEEGWFGRVVTAAPVIEVEKLGEGSSADLYGRGPAIEPPRTASFEEQWAPRERGVDPAGPEHGHDLGIDR